MSLRVEVDRIKSAFILQLVAQAVGSSRKGGREKSTCHLGYGHSLVIKPDLGKILRAQLSHLRDEASETQRGKAAYSIIMPLVSGRKRSAHVPS